MKRQYKNLTLPNLTILILSLFLLNQNAFSCDIKKSCNDYHWKIYLTQLRAPRAWVSTESFTEACFKTLSAKFDSTTYQMTLLDNNDPLILENSNKRDMIIESDTVAVRGKSKQKKNDTITIWLKFKTGFKYSKLSIPVTKENINAIPDSIAKGILDIAMAEFIGCLHIKGGPEGLSMNLSDELTLEQPCRIYLPFGVYGITASYPNFKTRVDSITINPGQVLDKRILLLPIE